ncbi:2-dehydropantoate 2-reductase [Vibrio sp. S9_S30]|uniref:2-dehydropantoate 2-reductase n=1 Tax=Vibrio sp. S9_S30 TaxID=2720226 RepID=UPI001680A3EB|nr:2-dehydropantoate 2-reductase [Vibrio sp. S9_S30]MBD1555699.1 2-dehydropantoate 2-reductase [Vibrio sp. S9_S30]
MNIVILGPGAVGSLWATSLATAGHHVSLWTRHNHKQQDLSLDDKAPITFEANKLSTLEKGDVILITVKAWQVQTALLPILPHLHPDTILLFLHNGMGAIDTLKSNIDAFPIVVGTTTQAAYKPNTSQVMHTGVGQTQIGGFNSKGGKCEFLEEVLHHALPDVKWNPNIHQALWDKLAINCAINPLTGIHQCLNGDLALPKFSATLDNVTQELVCVMRHEGFAADFGALREKISTVIHATAKNHSSMQQDVFHQRKTEIEFITGYLIQVAARHRIPVPANQALLDAILTIEKSWISS